MLIFVTELLPERNMKHDKNGNKLGAGMDFTDDMICDVLYALQHPELQAQHAERGRFEPTETTEIETNRPIGRHFRDDSEQTVAVAIEPTLDVSTTLIDSQWQSQDTELHTLTRDYIVAATNHVVRKLERAS
jgi:hypothetical protein